MVLCLMGLFHFTFSPVLGQLDTEKRFAFGSQRKIFSFSLPPVQVLVSTIRQKGKHFDSEKLINKMIVIRMVKVYKITIMIYKF